ncbi:YibE/F family protein [bacterium]|nr:YibE/F family protein [bacterium]
MPQKSLLSFVFASALMIAGVYSSVAHAQELLVDKVETVKAQVTEIVSQEVKNIPGTDTSHDYQQIKVKVLEGTQKDQIITVDNDYLSLKVGEVFYLRHETDAASGREMYAVTDPYRLPALYGFIALFVICVLIFGGWQGLRGLIALALSFLFIFYLLFPGILHGYSPILVSVGVASLIIVLGSYITHGLNRTTTAAVVGMVITILLTGALAYYAVHVTRLSGFASEEAVYLNFDMRGSIDFIGLLLGSILIGLLGVLYDAAISQAIAIEELHKVGPHLSRAFIFKRALRIGREHIGALVNTLAIAYVGASLPLLLLFYASTDSSFSLNLNRELFATEVIRTMIGSIGLVLAVPITSLITVLMLIKPKKNSDKAVVEKEMSAVSHIGHSH